MTLSRKAVLDGASILKSDGGENPEYDRALDELVALLLGDESEVPESNGKLTYVDHDGARREVRGCRLTVDKLGRHWIWSESLQHNLVYKTKGREDALLAAIDSLLFTIQLKEERIAGLQRIADLANDFADQIKPDEERHD